MKNRKAVLEKARQVRFLADRLEMSAIQGRFEEVKKEGRQLLEYAHVITLLTDEKPS